MFFATDLDRTMIYSNKFIGDTEEAYEVVEYYDGRPISYMTTRALQLLKVLQETMPIVPITTRNLRQYKRIMAFNEYIVPELFVVNNGGSIYRNNELDEEWAQIIQGKINNLPVDYETIVQAFLKDYKGYVEEYKLSDQLIWLIIGERDALDEEGIMTFKCYANKVGWEVAFNGKKIYLYPQFLTKWQALAYIRKKYYSGPILCSGDSQFDFEMVTKADLGMMPKGAYMEAACPKKVTLTKWGGMRAAEEILEEAIRRGNQEKNLEVL